MTARTAIWQPVVVLLALAGHVARAQIPTESIDFAKDVAPILENHCLNCHQPGIEKGGISLDSIDALQSGGYLEHTDTSESYLLNLVTSQAGEAPEMPAEGDALSAEQVTVLRKWIEAGSPWPSGLQLRSVSKSGAEWWAWQPLEDANGDWKASDIAQHIDTLIDEKLRQKNLHRNPPADKRTLIRRATFDLTGLPPTPEEVRIFQEDTSPDAYERLIERLLNSPAYGERWGRHWLDVVRFGESNGFERNVITPNIWPFRDYVIQSLNQDKPFDQFIQEHIAGDVLAPEDPQSTIGTAFLVAGPYDNVGNQDAVQKAQIRANTLDEMIRATSEAFLGLTLGCARCHNHKFDPLTQEDYYSMYATFAGVTHGSAEWASPEDRANRQDALAPLQTQKAELTQQLRDLESSVHTRAQSKWDEYQALWTRPAIDRTGTEEQFAATECRFVRLTCEGKDTNVAQKSGFGIEEFEVYAADDQRNVALAANGASASGKARDIKDFPGAYGPQLAIDGKTGRRFIAAGRELTIELAQATAIDRVRFSSCTPDQPQDHSKFAFVAEYRIEVSMDGESWKEVANSYDRKPVPNRGGQSHAEFRIQAAEWTPEEKATQSELTKQLATLDQKIRQVPPLRTAWIGTKTNRQAKGPFFVFYGGSPQKHGPEVTPRGIEVIDGQSSGNELHFHLGNDTPEDQRRLALARWITHPSNPLTPRVLANRIWSYHFGTGIVATPNDFGYMGSPPAHPKLLDFLAARLRGNDWKIKELHRAIMLSETYRQSSAMVEDFAAVDQQSRLLWRFPPRRLSAEEIRDSILMISGLWQPKKNGSLVPDGGPGFRLYEYLQDNVATYIPRDVHGPETYRRAIYHQNARASVTDLMTDFDQPDCSYSSAKRSNTTTPLQALTLLNHQFSLDAAAALAFRLKEEFGASRSQQINGAFQLAYNREPSPEELRDCREFLQTQDMLALCRALLNTHELIYID